MYCLLRKGSNYLRFSQMLVALQLLLYYLNKCISKQLKIKATPVKKFQGKGISKQFQGGDIYCLFLQINFKYASELGNLAL